MSAKPNYRRLFVHFLMLSCTACSPSNRSASDSFSEWALQGKQVFEHRRCSACHTQDESRGHATAPDLSHPFLANNDILVKIHLKFVERSAMPPIKLSDEEIRLLSYYVAGLHADKHATVSIDKADARCPVCHAPVLIAEAVQANLHVDYLGEDFYFECRECLDAFLRVPEAFF